MSRVFFYCWFLFAAFAASVTAAIAGDPVFLFAAQVDNPATHIQITNVNGDRRGSKNFECISFAVTGDKAVAHVRFEFFYFDVLKKPIGSDIMDRNGPFAAGSKVDGPEIVATTDFGRYPNCIAYNLHRPGLAAVVVAVSRVDFADGTSWIGSTPEPSPTPTPSS